MCSHCWQSPFHVSLGCWLQGTASAAAVFKYLKGFQVWLRSSLPLSVVFHVHFIFLVKFESSDIYLSITMLTLDVFCDQYALPSYTPLLLQGYVCCQLVAQHGLTFLTKCSFGCQHTALATLFPTQQSVFFFYQLNTMFIVGSTVVCTRTYIIVLLLYLTK